MQSNYLIKRLKDLDKGEPRYKLSIYSKKICEDLVKQGAPKNKHAAINFPNLPIELVPHFIRGYFDGDGCIWDGKRKKLKVKDAKSKTGYRERIVHNVKFTFTGGITFIEQLQEFLITNVGFSKVKLNRYTSRGKVPYCTLEYSGRGNIKKLYDFMYPSASIFASSKKLKFETIICALDEKSSSESGLTAGTPEMVISNQAEQSEGSSTIPEMEVESSDSKRPALSS